MNEEMTDAELDEWRERREEYRLKEQLGVEDG